VRREQPSYHGDLVKRAEAIPPVTDRHAEFYSTSHTAWRVTVWLCLAALPGLILGDHRLMAISLTVQWPGLVALMRLATWLGYGALDIGVLVVLAVYGWWDGNPGLRARGTAGALTVAGAGLLDQVLKNVACRARPSATHAGAFFSIFPCFPASYAYASFPSGHATTAFATALLLACWYPRQSGLFIGLAVLVGLSRVVLGAHFPSDVLAGAVLGSGVALAAHAYVPAVRRYDAATHAVSK
jgi:membrane-associated phospholipid phosphatase